MLEERARLESLLQKKFTKIITVMFTDLKGSTSLAEEEGDLAMRLLIKHHNEIVFKIVEECKGTLVKTMGDGTMSYFVEAQDALRAAVEIQQSIEKLNAKEESQVPIQIRIGLHTGSGIVEKNDIFGDVVNVSSRFEGLANPGEIYFSEETFNSLKDKKEIYCRFIKTSKLKGKREPYKIFKAFWKEEEVEEDKSAGISLVIQRSGQEKKVIPVKEEEMTIGRTAENDITLDDPFISRRHARLFLKDESYFIEDLKSKLGVMVNGKKISKVQLKNGDEVTLSSVRIKFVETSKEKAKKTEPAKAMPSVDSDATMIHAPEPMNKLVSISKDGKIMEYAIPKEGLIIGRSHAAEVKLEDKMVSRRHARVWDAAGRIVIEDLGSNNGTFLDERRINKGQKMEVHEKQIIKVASYRLLVVNRMQKVDQSFFADDKLSASQKIKRFWRK